MDRLERLVNLAAALLDAKRPLAREALRERVPGYSEEDGAFRRAFERDKDALRAMGMPLVLEPFDENHPEDGSGYLIRPEEYSLLDPGLEPDELAALHLAASAVRLGGVDGVEAIWKLGGVTGPADRATAVAELPGGEHLAPLFGAIAHRATVRFTYKGEERTVDPYHLAFRKGWWYLSAYDHDRQAERQFRLDRFASAPAVGEPGGFVRSDQADFRPARPWEMGDEEPVMARLRVDADQALLVMADVGEERVDTRHPDGGVTFVMPVVNRENFRSFVLGLLDHAEILEPVELRDDMIEWLRAMAEGAPA